MLHKIKLKAVLVILCITFSSSDVFAAGKKVCVNSKGVISIKSKCLKDEKLLSAATINQAITTSAAASGPPGSQGATGEAGEWEN